MPELEVRETNVDGFPVLAVSGELNINTAPDLRDHLVRHVKARQPRVTLDLSGLSFMDTSGLATLIESHLKAEKQGGALVLFGLQPPILEVFEITRVIDLFTVKETQEQALAALREATG
jgi:anti-sigma B factor antagonist